MKAKDIMTTRIVTVCPGNSIRHAAQTMLDKGVSGLPVIDDDARLVGIISEGDLMRRAEFGIRPASAAAIPSSEQRARAYVKSHGMNVGDVMSSNVVTVDEEAPVSRIAALMEEHRIKRVPVTRAGKLVGIVSRRDLMRAIVTSSLDEIASGDAALRRSVMARLGEDAGLETARLNVTVANGIVHFWGNVDSKSQRDAARVVAEGMRGVAGVVDHMHLRRHEAAHDETGGTTAAAEPWRQS